MSIRHSVPTKTFGENPVVRWRFGKFDFVEDATVTHTVVAKVLRVCVRERSVERD